jgi:ribosome-associated translation inhibitor RaiA
MQVPLQITVHNTELDQPGRALIQEYAERLERFYDRVTGCRVTVDVPQRHQSGAPVHYVVRVDVTVPGDEIVVTRQSSSTVQEAIQSAFDAAGRQVQDYARRRRGAVKRHAQAGTDTTE